MLEKTAQDSILLDYYCCLLTEKQQHIMKLYYDEDYSLSEIAQLLNISRSAVLDHIKRSMKSVKEYEKKLHLIHNSDSRIKIYDKIKKCSSEEVIKLVEELEMIEYDMGGLK